MATDSRGPWDDVLAGWRPTRATSALRRYSDTVNATLVESWLQDAKGLRVLKTDLFDEAVGTGLYPVLRQRSAELVAVDVSAEVVRAARTRYPELDARLADVRELAFGDASFDVVVSNSTLDHFETLADVSAALEELHRVLVPDGRLIITLDNADNPLVAFRNVLPDSLLVRIRVIPYPTGITVGRRELARLLAGAGFEAESWTAIMHLPRVVLRVAAVLWRDESRLVRAAVACERLARAPTCHATGQFVAASARRT